ncbi:MAG TPA: hypothetical protein VE503_06705 [Ornithinibacter sp.]|nr:hypothetical protein [Ornithinibacter sp.]
MASSEGDLYRRGAATVDQAGYRNALDVHILPRFGALPLDEVTTAAVR